MVVTDTLENTKIKDLTLAYTLGFSDYQIPLIMSEEKLQNTLTRNGYRPGSSVGLFDGPILVGFVFNGVRGNCCYNCGTAIIPDYRGKGYARLLLEKTLSVLKAQAIQNWVLEVLTDNTMAINIYKSIGFIQSRAFNCYRYKGTMIRQTKTNTRVTLTKQQSITIPQGECIPSWQNEEKAIMAGGVPTWDITVKQKNIGTLCFDPKTGSIAQIYIQGEERRKGYAKETIIEAAKLCNAEQLRFINVDDSYQPLHNLLNNVGFECFATQLEMTNSLRGKA